MPRRISKVVLYLCNSCQKVFNDGPDAKAHWRGEHKAAPEGAAGQRRRGRPRKA